MIGARRVLLLCADRGIPWLGPSGASAHLRGIAGALQRRGLEVTVAVPALSDERGAVTDAPDLRVVTHPPRPRSRWLAEWRETRDARRLTKKALAGRTVDWIWERYALACDGGVRSDLPVLLEVNAPLTLERARYDRLRRARYAHRLERSVLRRAERVVAVSGWLADWCSEQGAAEVRHVPNGSALEPGDRARGRQRWQLEGTVAAFVGSLKPWHALEELAVLADQHPELTVVVAGTGPVAPPVHPRVRHLGHLDQADLSDLLAAADIGLAPSTSSAPPWFCPLKVVDYRAAGLPVLATATPEVAHLLQEHPWQDWSTEPSTLRSLLATTAPPRPRTWDTVVDEALAVRCPPIEPVLPTKSERSAS